MSDSEDTFEDGISNDEDDDLYREYCTRTLTEKKLQCQVCFLRVRIPFRHCAWAKHVVCEQCAGPLEECPTCKTHLSTGGHDGDLLKATLDLLSSQDCRYYQRGCRTSRLYGEDHETFCGFRPAVCRVDGCAAQDALPVSGLLKHIETDHRSKLITIEVQNTEILWIGMNGCHNFRWKGDSVLPIRNNNGSLFWLKFPSPSEPSFKLEVMWVGKPRQEYSLTISVQKEKNSNEAVFSKNIKAYVRKPEEEEGVKIRTDDGLGWRYKDMDYVDQKCLDIGEQDLNHFINGVCTLSFTGFLTC